MENKQLIGEIFSTKSWGDLKIIEYNGNRKVRVKFVKTGYEVVTSLNSIKKGCVRDRLLPSVYGLVLLELNLLLTNMVESLKSTKFGVACYNVFMFLKNIKSFKLT